MMFSEFKLAYPMPDKSSASTMQAIRHFKGDRTIQRLYSDGSWEIDKALRDLQITLKRVNHPYHKITPWRNAQYRMSCTVPEQFWCVLAFLIADGNLPSNIIV